MYFDSHAHLGEDCFAQDFVNIVEKMRAADVTGMMEIGCDGRRPITRSSWPISTTGSGPPSAATRTTRSRWTRRGSGNTARCARTRV